MTRLWSGRQSKAKSPVPLVSDATGLQNPLAPGVRRRRWTANLLSYVRATAAEGPLCTKKRSAGKCAGRGIRNDRENSGIMYQFPVKLNSGRFGQILPYMDGRSTCH